MHIFSIGTSPTNAPFLFYVMGCVKPYSLFFTGDVLDVLEHRHEWANFHFTWTHFKFVLTKMLPVVASHSKSADEAEINNQYDRERFLHSMRVYVFLTLSALR